MIEEVIDTTKAKLNPSPMDYVSLSYSSSFDRDVWAEANQFTLTPGANRLILVRDADRITRWQPLQNWLGRTRTQPGVYLVFVSDSPEQLSTRKGQQLPAHLAAIKAPRGYIVKCGQLAEPDAVRWVQGRAPLTGPIAEHLLTRTGGNLAAAAAVCSKLALFTQAPGVATINALVAESSTTDFTDHLIALEKRQALRSLDVLGDSDRIRAVALLDSRLDLLEKLNRMSNAGRSWRESNGINPFLLRQYLPYGKHYDSGSCSHRRRVLAVVDDALRSGARVAVMEALVALW